MASKTVMTLACHQQMPLLLGNGTCDPDFNCEALNFDNGDCQTACVSGQIEDCQENCIDASSLMTDVGTGACQFEYYCTAYEFDQGDYGPAPSVCDGNSLPDCTGTCIDKAAMASQLNNGVCDAGLSCDTWNKDAGDCVASQCTEPEDITFIQDYGLTGIQQTLTDCSDQCDEILDLEELGQCIETCLVAVSNTSENCTLCMMSTASCTQVQCGLQCQSSTTLCDLCVEENCLPDLVDCIGYTVE